jgi:hypothetical protein
MIRHGFMLLCALVALGCHRPASDEPPPPSPKQGPPSLKQMIVSKSVPNDLSQLALFYREYSLDLNRPPASLAEFKTYIQRDARKLASQLDEGVYVVIWKVNDLSSNSLIAYESKPDEQGFRLVAMGDGAVQKKNNQEFLKLLATAKSELRSQ